MAIAAEQYRTKPGRRARHPLAPSVTPMAERPARRSARSRRTPTEACAAPPPPAPGRSAGSGGDQRGEGVGPAGGNADGDSSPGGRRVIQGPWAGPMEVAGAAEGQSRGGSSRQPLLRRAQGPMRGTSFDGLMRRRATVDAAGAGRLGDVVVGAAAAGRPASPRAPRSRSRAEHDHRKARIGLAQLLQRLRARPSPASRRPG